MSTLPVPASDPPAKRSLYRPELDVLRFIAFFAVFLFHTVNYSADYFVQHHVPRFLAELLTTMSAAGRYGVDLFFVLSSYLITDLLLREKEQCGSLDVRFFYLRRILRIWPLYYFISLLTVTIPMFDPAHAFGLKYILPFLFLSGNWAMVAYDFPLLVPISPLWSVSVEEQFYLFWPPVVARLSRRQIVYAALGMILVANFTRLLLLLAARPSWSLWPNTFAHLDSIAAGILLAILLRGRSPAIGLATRIALMVCGVACISLRGYFQTRSGETTGGLLSWGTTLFGWPAVAASCALILFAFIGLNIKYPWLQYLGKVSYGLYVYHTFCILITERVLMLQHRIAVHTVLHAAIRDFISLGLTISVAAVSYALLEKPFLKLKEKFTHVRSRPV